MKISWKKVAAVITTVLACAALDVLLLLAIVKGIQTLAGW